MKLRVEVKQDHLERVVNGRNALASLCELVWNSLDADADQVEVKFIENPLGGLSEIQVSDNGHGIDYDLAKQCFKSLGNSWKAQKRESPTLRLLHGRSGEGRFSAFFLGTHVSWKTTFKNSKGKFLTYQVSGSSVDLGAFDITDPVETSTGSTGTVVTVEGIQKPQKGLRGEGAIEKASATFALYLRNYPAKIRYDGELLDPTSLEQSSTETTLPPLRLSDGNIVNTSITIIEWKHKAERAIHLCDSNGFPLAAKPPGIQTPGFYYTSYLKCDRFREWHEKGLLQMEDLHQDISAVIDHAKGGLRDFFRKRASERAKSIVSLWKEQEVYPYKGTPKDAVEEAERQVFDVVALNVNEYLPNFSASDAKSKRLSLMMLKSAIERSPEDARKIIQEVLDLPKEKQEELAALLDRTKLSSIINAAKLVGDRLDCLKGVESIIFHHEIKGKILERKHLHRILAENTWIFGEEYNLSVDDESLDQVLQKHLEILEKDRKDLSPVSTLEGKVGIVDLMLSKRVPSARAEEREHLVVELKRPSVKLNKDAAFQIESYAFAVAEDERFRDTNTKWVFWLIGNDMDEHVRRNTKQVNRPDGILHQSEDHRITIWVKTWGQIIDAAKAKLKFFETNLNYVATHDSGLDYLKKTHSKYLPEDLKTDN